MTDEGITKKRRETTFKRERLKAQLTQEQASERLDISLRSLQAYEEGECSPSFENAVKMAKLYGCKLDDFID